MSRRSLSEMVVIGALETFVMYEEVAMNSIAAFFIYIVGSILAIFIGCIGINMLEENALGWLLLALGVAYPAGMVIYYYRRQQRRQ